MINTKINTKRRSERKATTMNNTEQQREYRPAQKINGHSEEVVRRPRAVAAQQDQRQQRIAPVAVSHSSYLNEKDRHFRAAETVENAGDLALRGVDGVLHLDARLRDAREDGASPGALAAIERFREVYGQATTMLLFDFEARPYERW